MKINFIVLILLLSVENLFGNIEIENAFLKVIGYVPSGRFIIKTTGGDPKLTADKNAQLLYQDDPPTTFATIMVDKKLFQFGGEQGVFSLPMQVRNNSIIAIWSISDIEITQILEFAKGPTTGRMDSVKISYTIVNKDSRKHLVGLRLLLDTCLGKNDGASFRIPGRGNIRVETVFKGDDVPDYWYAFNDLGNPGVRAQCTLRGEGVTAPDMVIFAGWNRFNENSWDFQAIPGHSFRRSFIGSLDSLTADYWLPRNLVSGQSISFSTLYGIYGESHDHDDLFAVSPGGPLATKGEPVVITAEIQKTADAPANHVKAKIILPAGLKMYNNSPATKNLPDISMNSFVTQVKWIVVPDNPSASTVEYRIEVNGIINKKLVRTSVSRPLDIGRRSRSIFSSWQANNANSGIYSSNGNATNLDSINRTLDSMDRNLTGMDEILSDLDNIIENDSLYDNKTESQHAAEIRTVKVNMIQFNRTIK